MKELYQYLDRVSRGDRLSQEGKRRLPDLFEQIYSLLDSRSFPKDFRLASGAIARGATGRIALNAYLLLLARKAFGKDYVYTQRDKRLNYWALYLEFHIMRNHFGGWGEKGIYCCPTCTLSVFPLYCVDAFRWFDCDLLKQNVLKSYRSRSSVFARQFSQSYADWAMRFA
jgi:hypothetical protein